MINELIAKLNTAYGAGVVVLASDIGNVDKVPLKNPAFDYVSTGGVPVGRISEFIGAESSLKSYHTYLAMREFQYTNWGTFQPGAIQSIEWDVKEVKTKTGVMRLATVKSVKAVRGVTDPVVKRVALIDVEGTFDVAWAAKCGVDVEGLIIVQPTTLASAVDIADSLLRDPEICLVVLDSMSAVGSDSETEKSMEDDQMAVNARFWNRAVRKFQAALNSNRTGQATLIAVNTLTNKVGFVMGNPETPKNGTGIKYGKSLSVQFTGLKRIEVDGVPQGRNYKVECLKSKVGTPFRVANFYFSLVDDGKYPGKDKIDEFGTLLDLAVAAGIVTRTGAWYNYGEIKAQGVEKFKEEILKSSLLSKNLQKEVYNVF